MLRTWGEVVQAAGDLWQALPTPLPHVGDGPGGPPRDEVMMDRLQEMTAALHRSIRGKTWPGKGPGDPRRSAMAEALTRAAELVTDGETSSPTRRVTRGDLAAAKARLMHTLYVGVHGVAVAVGYHAPNSYHTRLSPALDAAQGGWASTARTWGELTPPSQRRPTPELSMAAAEARAAMREITHDRTGPAAPEVIAARTDLTRATAAIQQSLSTGVELAHVMLDTLQSPHLNGAARAVNAISMATDPPTPGAAKDLGHQAALVNPRDIAGNRPIDIPDLVLDVARANLDRTIKVTKDAMSAGAVLDHTSYHRTQPGTNSLGRQHQDRTAPSAPPEDRPAPRCER